MKGLFIPLIVLLLIVSGCTEEQEPSMDQYGSELVLEEITPIAEIMESPESYVGKKVQIEGEVVDVCAMKGCWMEIKDPKTGQIMKVKVEDDVIVFDQESKGKHAIAEGEIYEINLDQDQAISYLQHLADEKGEAFDSSSVTGPVVIYQLKGDGALVDSE